MLRSLLRALLERLPPTHPLSAMLDEDPAEAEASMAKHCGGAGDYLLGLVPQVPGNQGSTAAAIQPAFAVSYTPGIGGSSSTNIHFK